MYLFIHLKKSLNVGESNIYFFKRINDENDNYKYYHFVETYVILHSTRNVI